MIGRSNLYETWDVDKNTCFQSFSKIKCLPVFKNKNKNKN